MADQAPSAAAGAAGTKTHYALLFELETVAVNGRGALYDVLSGLLAEHKVELTPIQFSRYALHPSPAFFMESILATTGARKLSASKLAGEVRSGLDMYLSSSEAVLNSRFDAILKATQAQGIPVAALSALPESTAKALLSHLDLAGRGIELFVFEPTEADFPRADHWLKMAKVLGQNPRNCSAFVSSMESCKSALSASLRCVAMPDAFTSFQDFGGADYVIDEEAPLDTKALIEDLFPELVEA